MWRQLLVFAVVAPGSLWGQLRRMPVAARSLSSSRNIFAVQALRVLDVQALRVYHETPLGCPST